MDRDHSEDPEYVSVAAFERKIEDLESQLNRARNRITDLESDMRNKADDRYTHREYADERHYH